MLTTTSAFVTKLVASIEVDDIRTAAGVDQRAFESVSNQAGRFVVLREAVVAKHNEIPAPRHFSQQRQIHKLNL